MELVRIDEYKSLVSIGSSTLVKVKGVCKLYGHTYETKPFDSEEFINWMHGTLIQLAFKSLDKIDREFIKTGLGTKAQQEIFNVALPAENNSKNE